MKSIKKTFIMTSARVLVYDRNIKREVERTFDFDRKLSLTSLKKGIQKVCEQNDLSLLEIRGIKDNKVTFTMPFNKFISLAEKVEDNDNE